MRILVSGIIVTLLAMQGPAHLAAQAQESYFTHFPIWSSDPTNGTRSVALGDVDGDGDLDLVCGNFDENNTFYENTDGMFTFAPIWSSAPTNSTLSVALGDVDGDGDLDLVCGNGSDFLYGSRNTLYENIGGTFASTPIWSSAPTNWTQSVTLGDIDGDGDLDLVCGNHGENTLYENTGGTLASTPIWSSSLANNTTSVALGDVDGDGDLDLVCGNSSGSNTLYENIGGTFSSTPIWSSGPMNETYCIALGDVDGDGDLDLVCGNIGQSNTVYENVGGTFASAPIWSSAPTTSTFSVTLGDVDGDGDLDLLCGDHGGNTLYENTAGTFSSTPVWSSALARWTQSVALGDVDGDGNLDLVCGNDGSNNTVYQNTAGTFVTTPVWSSSQTNHTLSIAIGDVDGDGDLDLVFGNYGSDNTLYENLGGTFSSTPIWSWGLTNGTFSVVLGDVDRDGDLDLVCGNAHENTLYENLGGTFSLEPIWSSGPANSTVSVALGDVDGDGDLDLVCGNEGSNNTLYENLGGTFSSTPTWSSAPTNSTLSVALGDVDGDGDLDLVCGNYAQNNTLYENLGGTFSLEPIWSSGPANSTVSVALGDVDGDGDLDLVCGNAHENTLYENLGGTFSLEPIWSSGPANSTVSVALGDVDGDGDLDLVCGNEGSNNTLYENTAGTFVTTPVWSSSPTNYTRSIAIGDVDGDGDLDLVCGNAFQSNTLYSNIKNPPYKGDLLVPTNQAPNNGAFIGRASALASDENHYQVKFVVYDMESDLVWIVPEYQFVGEPRWRPAYLVGGDTRFGPIPAAPEGVTDSLEWDITQVPFDQRDVVLRLRTVEIPVRVSAIQHASSYLQTAGHIVPIRPELSSSADSLLFSQATITVGDTTSIELVLSNTGTVDLDVSRIELPSAEMRITSTAPFTLQPGRTNATTVFLEPRMETDISGMITIASNDPITPSHTIVVVSDIRSLDVTHELLKASDVLPLGEAVTVVVTPAPHVNVERGHVFFRAAGSSTFADSTALSSFKDEFVALIPGRNVTEAGLEYYIRVENSGVFGTDPSGAPDSFYTQAVESPMGISSEPVPNSGSDFVAGREIKVYAIMPTGAQLIRGALHYRQGGSYDYMVDSLVLEDVFPEASIPDSMVGACGVEYWVDAETETAHLSDPAVSPPLHPHTIQVTVQDLVEPGVHAGGVGTRAYRMMSIPLRFEDDFAGTIEALLSDQPEFGPYDPVKWRSWVYLPESATYGELSDKSLAQSFRPEPGRAFWLISRADHRISTAPVSGLSTPTDGPFALELASGWNMIGAPFAFPVGWDSVRVDTLSMSEAVGIIVDPPVRWNGGYGYEVPLMEPFDGYWIYNRVDNPVTLYIPAKKAADGIPHAPLAIAAQEEDFRVLLHVISGDREDSFSFLGTSPRADRHLDRLDRMKPPPAPGQGISLYFATDKGERCHRLSADIRSSSAGESEWGEVWAFDVMKSVLDDPAGDAVTISVDSIKNLPVDASIVFIDRTLGRELAFGRDAEYTFYLGLREYVESEKEARFRILVGTETFVQEQATRLFEMPSRAALYQNYPNPFNPSTIIRYDIAEPGMVSIRIYNVAGALVRVLEERHHDRGRYEAGWNGENDRGDQLSSGIYFYRLTAPGYSQTRKIVLIR